MTTIFFINIILIIENYLQLTIFSLSVASGPMSYHTEGGEPMRVSGLDPIASYPHLLQDRRLGLVIATRDGGCSSSFHSQSIQKIECIDNRVFKTLFHVNTAVNIQIGALFVVSTNSGQLMV